MKVMAQTNAILPLNSWLPWLLVLLANSPSATAAALGVASSGRSLTLEGKPFFWLGDTVWLLAQVPSRDELELYLRTRAEQGFTVIQLTAVMGEERVWGTLRTTSRGDIPFIDGDPLRPAVTSGNDPTDPAQYDYWDHLDHVLERVHAHGLRAALVADFVGWGGDGYKFLKPINALVIRRQACWSWFAGGYHTTARAQTLCGPIVFTVEPRLLAGVRAKDPARE